MIRIALKNSLNNKTIVRNTLSRSIHSGPGLPPLQQAGFGKVLFILTPIAAGAGVVAYAKYDDKFRKTLVDTVPGIDPVLKVFLREEGNAFDEASKSISKATQKVSDMTSTVTGYFGGGKNEPQTKFTPPPNVPAAKSTPSSSSTPSTKLDSSLNVPAPPLSKPSPSSASTPSASSTSQQKPIVKEPVKKSDLKPAAPVDLPPPPTLSPQIAAPIPLPKTINELEVAVAVAAKTAVQEYEKAIKVLKIYNDEIQKTVEDSIQKLDNSGWNLLKNKTSARDTAVEAAESAAIAARSTIDKLEKSISNLAKDTAPELIDNVKQNIRKFSSNLDAAKDQLYNAKDTAKLSEKYWRNVESARNYFVNEIEALFPGINITEKQLNMSKDDIDLFIAYAHSHVLAYQKALQKLQIEGETRLQRALDAMYHDDQTEAIKNKLEYSVEKEKQEMSIEYQKKLFKALAENEKQLRQQLKRQSEVHTDHLSDALAQKELEMRRIFNRELSEKLTTEQASYKEQLATMLGKLKGMDAALKEIDEELKARADAERQVHQAQSLWSACQALWASVRTGEPGVAWQNRLRPLASEVSAVSKAGEGDELVAAVLHGVPNEAKSRGVYPEDALRERFFKVDKLARRLAMVPENGARLPIYLLSYLQSMFILTPSESITTEELNNEPFDFSSLDTYEILNRSRYWIERGNLIQALKYMNLLKGASRYVASDWLKEARLLLETQQATNTLMAHAAASGLSFL